jgi:carbon monoxide dehydrogenase subunit G
MAIELEHSFAVPVPPDQAWDVLLDVQRVAPCMPGATVDTVDGDEVTGKIKVKVGPIALTYSGKATFTDKDPVAHSLKMEAAGKETRGAGTATATVLARLDEENGQTRVNVHTSLNVTGRPAQFGRGVMADVSGRIIEKFSANLAAQLAAGSGPEPVPPTEQAPDNRMAIPIQELNLPARSYNSLKSEGIDTVGELVTRTESDLLAMRNLGEKSVGEIEERLGDLGLGLAEGAPHSAAALNGSAQDAGVTVGSAAAGSAAAAGTGAAGGPGESAPWDGGSRVSALPGASAGVPVSDEPDDDALNLLDVAAGPILKRVLPAVAAVAALVWLGTRLRGRRRG